MGEGLRAGAKGLGLPPSSTHHWLKAAPEQFPDTTANLQPLQSLQPLGQTLVALEKLLWKGVQAPSVGRESTMPVECKTYGKEFKAIWASTHALIHSFY